MLKRHLKTAYDMSPEDYRERWGLPADYPMVAPHYARQRSKLAKQIGLRTRARRKARGSLRGRTNRTRPGTCGDDAISGAEFVRTLCRNQVYCYWFALVCAE